LHIRTRFTASYQLISADTPTPPGALFSAAARTSITSHQARRCIRPRRPTPRCLPNVAAVRVCSSSSRDSGTAYAL